MEPPRDILGQTVEVVDSSDMHVTARIDASSRVLLRSSEGRITLDGSSIVYLVAFTGSIAVGGKVDGNAVFGIGEYVIPRQLRAV